MCPFAVRNLSRENNSMLSPPSLANHQTREWSRGAPVCLHTEKGLSSSSYWPGDYTNTTQTSGSAAPKGKGAPLRWLLPSEELPQHRPGPHGAVGFHSGLQGQVGQLDPSYFDSDLTFSTQKKLVKMRRDETVKVLCARRAQGQDPRRPGVAVRNREEG